MNTRVLLIICIALTAVNNLPAQQPASEVAVPYGMQGSDLLRMSTEGRHGEVVLLAPELIRKNPQDTDAWIGFAWSLNALKQYTKSLEIARQGYAKFKDPRLSQAIGESSYYLGENEAALAAFREYLARFPEGSRAAVSYYFCGELYLRMGMFNHADIAFSTALQYSPSNARWWERLGWAREKSARYLAALKAYEKALSLNPSLQDALNGKARMLAKIKS